MDILVAAALAVSILDTQQKHPAMAQRQQGVEQGGTGISQVNKAGRTGGKTGFDRCMHRVHIVLETVWPTKMAAEKIPPLFTIGLLPNRPSRYDRRFPNKDASMKPLLKSLLATLL